ncbi:hypothetical protein HUK80_10925 [Flavobacterium sp. MAH-1]|uniref:Aspartyl protease n=1 Tax=Flavobacterium agri TaxID=2743471 RepID=A0A7Y8Y2S8_9FLAO|nr:hypothetical protein [Flavobacterium agri]NUY81412.1 hypothetical protein [Flavobacterium agri]NYA71436.1 hypothetical protein [Flavobacterium agri]
MKLFKKIALAFVILFALALLGGYFYFENKFSPPENYLTVSGSVQDIPLKWHPDGSHSAVYLPVKISGIDKTFYMQLDSGSPVTLFYKTSLESIEGFRQKIDVEKKQVSLSFNLGEMQVSSQNFQVLEYGEKVDFENPSAKNIIGTIGTDLFEKRVVTLDFKANSCSFESTSEQKGFEEMEFKKRRMLFPASIENRELKLLYDSGSSAYELITNQEEWTKFKSPNAQIKTESGNSWGNTLKVISAAANRQIGIGKTTLNLSQVTYVEGTSAFQDFLMKSSGMQGMIGNKLFINHKLILDCRNERFKID